ncbi:MAG: AP2 domain-containing protein [Prolixibacteraceae bacterium]|jgi:hypothetical protein|nr:AP2 domain-containing protein [Prolixibacteraceae bacterium]
MPICRIENCTKKTVAKDMCPMHYKQIRVHGKIMDYTDKYELSACGSTCTISLRSLDKIIGTVLIDASDIELVNKYKWYFNSDGYATTTPKNRIAIRMHKLIFPVESPHQVDHANKNKSDNRRCNLRKATTGQNRSNVGLTNSNTIGFKGVSKRPGVKSWRAMIKYKQKQISIGTFKSAQEAADAYDKAALELHGEFAYTNKMIREESQSCL